MKKWLWVFFFLITSNCLADTLPAVSKEALLQKFQEALNAKNEEAIMNLSYWEGVNEEDKSFYRKEIIKLASEYRYIKGFALKPDSGAWQREYNQKGIRFRDNLPVLGVVEVQITPDFLIFYPYGKKEDFFYFTHLIKEKLNAAQKFYFIIIGGDDPSKSFSDHF